MMALRILPQEAWSLRALLDGLLPPSDLNELPDGETLVQQLALDSRRLGPGCLFLAIRGQHQHGIAHLDQALRQGCVAVLAEPSEDWSASALISLGGQMGVRVIPVANLRQLAGPIAARFYGEPFRPGPELRDQQGTRALIGVTGTNGKTSVSHFIAQALSRQRSCGLIGTLGNGFPEALHASGMTTPDAVELQFELARLRGAGADSLAMEVSSHALDQARVAGVPFSHAVFTNLTRDHLDYHGSMDDYALAKQRLFAMPELQWAIVNQDDARAELMLSACGSDVKIARFSLNPQADLRDGADLWVKALAVQPMPSGLHLRLDSSLGQAELQTRLIGRFNAANLLASLLVQLSLEIPLEQALSDLVRVKAVPGRMEPFGGDGAPLVLVDYAHTPDALTQALQGARAHCAGRLFVVFGCGGDRDIGKRPLMGEVAERLSDRVILTDDNPRSEDSDLICQQILTGMKAPDAVLVERQRALAIRRALAFAGPQDLVLVAGKGHETQQDMGELRVHFSDRAQVVQALQEWRGTAMPASMHEEDD